MDSDFDVGRRNTINSNVIISTLHPCMQSCLLLVDRHICHEHIMHLNMGLLLHKWQGYYKHIAQPHVLMAFLCSKVTL